jgi:transposase InsO family protein
VIASDRDSKFTSLFWKGLMARFDTKLAMSTAYHPQTDGQSENMVRTIKEMLRHYISHSQKDWDVLLPVLEFAYNNSVNASIGMTPFEFDLGYHTATPHTVSADIEVETAEKYH